MRCPVGATYLVWDWNGTLFDDRELLFQSVAATLRQHRHPEPSAEEILARFTRPLRALFEQFVGGHLSSQDWEPMKTTFHGIYRSALHHGALASNAHQALVRGKAAAQGQTLVSQWPHHDLVEIVQYHRLSGLFSEIHGRSADYPDKVGRIEELIRRNRLDPDQVVLIGDTRDDVAAARRVGIRSILLTGASLEPLDSNDAGVRQVPVAHCPVQAVELALLLGGESTRAPAAVCGDVVTAP